MGVTDRLRNKGNAYCIVLIAAILFFMFSVCHPACIYADDDKLIIDPESISGEYDKDGNVLAEYGFAVFTEESMLSMEQIKDRKEKDRMRAVAGLFESEWRGSANYDKEVNAVIKAGALFEKVDTGVEVSGDTGMNPRNTQKWRWRIAALILTCIMSAAAVRLSRKRYEDKRNIRTR